MNSSNKATQFCNNLDKDKERTPFKKNHNIFLFKTLLKKFKQFN